MSATNSTGSRGKLLRGDAEDGLAIRAACFHERGFYPA
jgi:hypothetical protein